MKVLLALDASTGSQDVVNEVAARPWPTGTAFCLVSIVDATRWEKMPTLIKDTEHAAKIFVDAAAQKLDYPGCEVFSEIGLGFPKQLIPAFARQWKADLIVVGSRGQNAVTRFFLGSVALAVLRSAPCSVEIVRAKSQESPASSHGLKILLATDGSECSETAARSVAKRPWPAGSQIKVICARDLLVLENPTSAASPCPVYPESLLTEILEDAEKRAQKAATEAQQILRSAGLEVCDDHNLPVGDPRSIILDEAHAWGANLIVLGSHGRHGLDRMLLGSVSESVAMHAHCSVEVIR